MEKAKDAALVVANGQTDLLTKVSGKIMSDMVRESSGREKALFITVSSRTILDMAQELLPT